MEPTAEAQTPLCPSARPEMAGSVVFGVVGGSVTEPRVGYLKHTVPVTDALPMLTAPARPNEVLRIAAPCAGDACTHFDGASCRLATRITAELRQVVDVLPACRVRPHCRWWQQEGAAACLRCPQIVTDSYHPSEQLRHASDPAAYDAA